MRGQVEDERRGGDDQREDDDENALDDAGVAEKDNEPVEEKPHGTKPQKEWQKEKRHGKHGHRSAAHARSEHFTEVVRHRAAVTNEQRDREDHRGQCQRRCDYDQRIGPAQDSRAILLPDVGVTDERGRNRFRPVLLFRCSFRFAERDCG